MTSTIIALGRLVWRSASLLAVRQLCLRMFTNAVRGKKTTHTIEGMTFDLDVSENSSVCLFLGHFERDEMAAIESHRNPVAFLARLGYFFCDAKALAEYPSVDEIKRAVDTLDQRTSVSINILALPVRP